MVKKNDLSALLAQKRLRGDQVGRLIAEDYLLTLSGQPGLLTDADSRALSDAVTASAERAVIRKHIKICQLLYTLLQEAELASMTAQRNLYWLIGQILLLRDTQEHAGEEPQDFERELRLSVMIWLGQYAAIEEISEYLRVDFMVLLEVPRQELSHVVKMFNLVIRLAPKSDEPDTPALPKLRAIDVEDLQPCEEWREELAEALRHSSQWLDKASKIRFVSKSQ